MSFHVVIPARWASARLPGKALADVAGVPLVVRCLQVGERAQATDVVVAVDDSRIAVAVEAAGGTAMMTSDRHESGTDRLAEVAEKARWSDDEIVVNLQGDEPLVAPEVLSTLAAALVDRPDFGIATMATRIHDAAELCAESCVKVTFDCSGRALYFSRAPIPWVRGWSPSPGAPLPDDVPYHRHLGLYAYRVRTLRRIAAAPTSAYERAESLEQLRAMELGIGIHVGVLDRAPPPGVDTPEDLARVRTWFTNRSSTESSR